MWENVHFDLETVAEYATIVDNDSVTYEFLMPGLKKDQISIETDDLGQGQPCLLIKSLNTKDTKSWIRNKIYFFYVNPKTRDYDVHLATSKLEDGILYVKVPKKAEKIVKKTKIEIG